MTKASVWGDSMKFVLKHTAKLPLMETWPFCLVEGCQEIKSRPHFSIERWGFV